MEALSWLTLFFQYYFLYDCINPWRGGPSPEELAADDNRHMDAVDPRLVYSTLASSTLDSSIPPEEGTNSTNNI